MKTIDEIKSEFIRICYENRIGEQDKEKLWNMINLNIISNEIVKFFDAMEIEFIGIDNGVDPSIDKYVFDRGLRPFLEYYIKRFENTGGESSK
jgi:hypothetical protein